MISQLGRYEVLDELGQGAMGVVYKAVDPLIDRVVALKTINLSLALDEKEEYEARFYQEAKAAGRLSHPNIVTIYDVGKSNDVAYIAMEYLQGRELRDIMNEDTQLSVNQILDIVIQVALGLAYAHEHDIVHRDVKPSNIMVIRDGHVKITDFGIARMASSAVRTQTGMVLGSPKYMSPEQVMGKALDQRSDIFSLGVMFYEMLTKQAPFTGENVNAIMYQTLNGVPPPPNTLNTSVPEMVNFIVAKALAKALDDRYSNAKDFANDLRACRETLPRSGEQADLSKIPAGGERKLPHALDISGSWRADEEEGKTTSTMGLSKSFDSAAATMRLAALTTDAAEVDELAQTLKIEKPGKEGNRKIAPSANPVQSPPVAKPAEPGTSPGQPVSNGMLAVIVLLVIVGIVVMVFI
ncbi:MAG: serine/threonine-protein kinase [Pseudomonadota bacterium]